MRTSLYRAAAASLAVVVVVVLASLGGPALLHLAREATPAAPSTPAVEPLVTDAVRIPAGLPLRALPASYPVPLTFTLASPHPRALAAFLSAVSDPRSPLFQHFLTYPEYEAEFAPTPSELSTVLAALRADGATSWTVTPDRSGITTTLSAAGVDALLGVELNQYGVADGRPLFSAVGAPRLASALAPIVVGVEGLSYSGPGHLVPNLSVVGKPVALRASNPSVPSTRPGQYILDNSTHTDFFVGSDFTQAYNATALFPGSAAPNATYPTGVAIATLLAGGYNATAGQDLPPWDPSVINAYFNDTLAPSWPKPSVIGVPVAIGSVQPPLPGFFGGLNDTSGFEFENSLDLEMAGDMAPGAPLYNFYFAGSLLAGNPSASQLASDFGQSLAEALAYHYSPAHLAVVSGSFGLPDLNNSLWNVELGVAEATGVSGGISSGDQGNAPDSLTGRSEGPWPTWPASAAFNSTGAVAVGGVSLTLDGSPSGTINATSVNLTYDPLVRGIGSTSAWWDAQGGPGTVAGTEGGVSTVYPEPYWQFHSAAQPTIVNATIDQGANALGRAEPDIAFPANDTVVTAFENSTGTIFAVVLGGTSVAAPVFAGLIADVLAVRNGGANSTWTGFGYLAPQLYQMAGYFAAHPSSPIDPFLDVTVGRNYVFSAGPGWDATTGWGGLDALRWLSAATNRSVATFVYTGPTPGLPPASPGSSTVPWTMVVLVFGIGLAVALGLVLLVVRPRRPTGPVQVPFGAQGTPGAPYGPSAPTSATTGATFACPYCGASRPAEPVRCPQCGAL